MKPDPDRFIRVGSLAELEANGRMVVKGRRCPLLVVHDQGRVFALEVGPIDQSARAALDALPDHRRHCPSYTGPDIEKALADARAQDDRGAERWKRKTGGRLGEMG